MKVAIHAAETTALTVASPLGKVSSTNPGVRRTAGGGIQLCDKIRVFKTCFQQGLWHAMRPFRKGVQVKRDT